MVATLYQGGQTTYNDAPTPAANKIITVKQWGSATDPRETPLLDKIGFGNALDQRPWYWGQSYRRSLQTTAAEAIDVAEVAINVATGTGKYFRKGHVIEIIDFIAGSTTIEDESTKEICVVASVSTDTITVASKGYAGTSDQAHADGCNIYIIGTAEKEYETTRELDVVARGSQFYNYFQRANGGVAADIAAQNMPTWEHPTGNPMMADLAEVRKDQHLLLERAIWRGARAAGSTSTPALLGGFDTFITTNVTNLAGAKLTPNLLEVEMRDLVKTVEGGGKGLTFLMSYDTAAILDRVLNPIRQATAQDTTIKFFTESIEFRWGKFDIMASRNCRNGVIYAVDFSKMKMHPFRGADWHLSKKEGKQHGVDHDQVWLSGDFTLVLQEEQRMFKMYGFNQLESAYAGYQTFNA